MDITFNGMSSPILCRMSSAKIAKAETEEDLKAVLELLTSGGAFSDSWQSLTLFQTFQNINLIAISVESSIMNRAQGAASSIELCCTTGQTHCFRCGACTTTSLKRRSQIQLYLKEMPCHAEFLAALTQPELPVAELVLKCFLGFASGPRGLKHPDSGVRQICIDLLSQTGQHFFKLAKKADSREKADLRDANSTGMLSPPVSSAHQKRLKHPSDHLSVAHGLQ